MSSLKSGIIDSLTEVETEIKEVKGTIKMLEEQVESFNNDKSRKDRKSRDANLEDKKRLSALIYRLAGLESRRDRLEAQAPAPPCNRYYSLIPSIASTDIFLSYMLSFSLSFFLSLFLSPQQVSDSTL